MSASSSRASSRQPFQRGRRRRSSAHSTGSTSMRLLDRCEYTYAVAENSISEWLKCPICLCPFVEPVRSPECEHVFCKTCLEQHLRSGREGDDSDGQNDPASCGGAARGQCPTCRAQFTAPQIRPAAALIKNMVDALLVKCPHVVRGCTHTCERGLVGGHARRDCGWMFVGEYDEDELDANQERTPAQSTANLQRGRASPGRCECGSKVLRKDWKMHITSGECAVERVACPYAEGDNGCGTWVKECDLDEHTQDCPARPVQCTYCDTTMRQGELHVHDGVCDEADVSCPLAQFGCTWHGRRGDLGDAETSTTRPSLHLANCTLWPLRTFLKQTETHTSNLERENNRLANRLEALEQEQASVKSLVEKCVRALGSSFVVPPLPSDTNPVLASVSSAQVRAATPPPASRRGRSGSSLAVSSSEGRQAPFSPSPSIGILSLAHASAPATSTTGETEFPWQWPEAEFGGTTTASPASHANAPIPDVHPASLAAVTVSGSLEQLHATLASMAERIMAVERRLDDVHGVSLNSSFEASRAHEELNSVRHGMHSVRLQMHSLLMQQQMERTLPGQMFPQGLSAAASASSALRASSEGQQVMGATPGGGPTPPAMMGLRRFWAGFEQTKL